MGMVGGGWSGRWEGSGMDQPHPMLGVLSQGCDSDVGFRWGYALHTNSGDSPDFLVPDLQESDGMSFQAFGDP